MENILKQTEPIPRREIAYYRRRNQNRLFSKLAEFFSGEAEAGRATRKQVAFLLGKDPAQISRWLSGPTNFECDTTSDLLLAMGAELDYHIVRFCDRPAQNYSHPVHVKISAATTNVSYRVSFKQKIEHTQYSKKMQVEVHKNAESSAPIKVTVNATF